VAGGRRVLERAVARSINEVATGASAKDIGAPASHDHVVTVPALNDVVAILTGQGIVAAQALDEVRPASAGDKVGGVGLGAVGHVLAVFTQQVLRAVGI